VKDMSEPLPSSTPSLEPSAYRRVDAVCNRFEEAWKRGQRPRLEDYLKDAAGRERSVLLVELLIIEILYRKRTERLTPAEFQGRFPEDLSVIQQAFEAVADARLTGRRGCAAHAGVDSQQTGPDLGEQQSPEMSIPAAVERKSPSIPGFRILRVLGRGGMGIVYKAEHLALKRHVALKMILAGEKADSKDLDRFRMEAEAVARLQHPNIVQIFEIGEHEGCPFFCLELVDGESLAQKLKGEPLPAKEAANLVQTLARAMHAAHGRKIVHRDLKPANVLLTPDGVPKITDFGLAKRLDADSRHTRTGAIMGTPSYMAPEQAAGKIRAIGPTTAVYALGAILYEALTGRPPFQAATPLDTVLQVMEREPVSPRRLRPELSRDLETICLRCLQKEQGSRYPSAEALAADLQAFLEGRPIQSRPVTAAGRLGRWCRRNPVLSSVSAAASALLILAGVMASISYMKGKDVERLTGVTEEQKEKVEEERGRVQQQEEVARKERESRRAKEYLEAVQRVPSAWQELDFRRAQQLLESCLPQAGETDHRQWEWYYLQALVAEAAPLSMVGELSQSETISKVCWSPDDRFLACVFSIRAGTSQGIKVWDAGTAQLVFSEEASPGGIGELMWSPDGKRLAGTLSYQDVAGSRSEDRCAVSIYEIPARQKLRTLFDGKRAWSRNVRGRISWSADGKRLAAIAPDMRSAGVWEVATGRELLALRSPAGEMRALAWSPDGQTIVTGEADGIIRVWDAESGREAFSLRREGSSMAIHAVSWKPDSQELACLYRGEEGGLNEPFAVTIWTLTNRQARVDLAGRDLPRTLNDSFTVGWSKNGQRLSLNGGEIMSFWRAMPKIWDTGTGREVPLKILPNGPNGRPRVIFDPLARWLTEFPLRIRMVDSEEVVNSVNGLAARTLWPLVWNCQGDGLLIRGGSPNTTEGGKLLVWSLRGEARAKHAWMLPEVDTFAWSPDSRRFVAGKRHQQLGGTDYKGMDLQIGIVDQQRLLTLRPIDRESLGHPRLKIRIPPGIRSFAWSPDVQRLATVSTDGIYTLWNPETGEAMFSWPRPDATRPTAPVWPGCLTWSPDSRRIATGITEGVPNRVGRWEVQDVISARETATGNELFSTIKRQPARADMVNVSSFLTLAWSPDGSQLASVVKDPSKKGFQITIWDAITGQELRSILDDSVVFHGPTTYLLAWRADGKQIASCIGHGNSVRIWDSELGRAVQALNMPANSEPVDLLWIDPQRLVLRSKARTGDQNRNHLSYLDVWDPETGDKVLSLQGPATAFHLSPDKRWVFNGSSIQQLRASPAS
jgi:serine/threonine protein kinase/WD40 repeat protein